MMRAHIRPALVLLLIMSVATGLLYPLTVTGVAQLLFPVQANGSLIIVDSRTVGSALIGQEFSGDEWLIGRPSAIGTPYDARTSSGSNLGPTSAVLDSLLTSRVQHVRLREGLPLDARVPADIATASGSGLDPHLSPAAAALQVPRIARVRGLSEDSVRAILARATRPRDLGTLGEPRVNVLLFNLMLDGRAVTLPGAF